MEAKKEHGDHQHTCRRTSRNLLRRKYSKTSLRISSSSFGEKGIIANRQKNISGVMQKFRDSESAQTYVAVVAGATGATGRWIVRDLLNSDKCTKVVALTRSDISVPSEVFPGADEAKISAKLVCHKIDWNFLKESGEFRPPLPGPASVAFCGLGSSPYTEESDFTMPVAFGKASKKLGVGSMFLVSSAGAKAGSWIGLLHTLGRREDAFKAIGFGRLGIFRPGMMDRQEMTRTKELIGRILPSRWVIDTREVAKSMVAAAARMKEGTHEFSHEEMKRFASSGAL